MFFAAPLHGFFHHTFTTIYPSFTIYHAKHHVLRPKFAKNPPQKRKITTHKKIRKTYSLQISSSRS
jgi:hypothetical protein